MGIGGAWDGESHFAKFIRGEFAPEEDVGEKRSHKMMATSTRLAARGSLASSCWNWRRPAFNCSIGGPFIDPELSRSRTQGQYRKQTIKNGCRQGRPGDTSLKQRLLSPWHRTPSPSSATSSNASSRSRRATLCRSALVAAYTLRGAPLSFGKAEQLIALATLAAARHAGITLDDVKADVSTIRLSDRLDCTDRNTDHVDERSSVRREADLMRSAVAKPSVNRSCTAESSSRAASERL